MEAAVSNNHAMGHAMGASRRTFLRGLGTAIGHSSAPCALPRPAWARADATTPPLRMAFCFIPNGVHMPAWQPTEEGTDFTLPSSLEPLDPWRQKLLVLSGLALDAGFAHGDGPGDHARCASTFLTGAHPVKTDGKGIRAGVSVDQAAAAAWSGRTPLRVARTGDRGRTQCW